MKRFPKDPRKLFARDTHPELPLDPDVVQPGVYKWPLHLTPQYIFVVFIGGCLGAGARYWFSLLLPTSPSGWPTSTLIVNLLGAFLLGFLLEGLTRLGDDAGARRIVRLGIGTGFMGAFTTYSTLTVELDQLIRHDNPVLAVWYALVSVVGGIICSAFGIWAAASHHKYRKARQ